jgi:hypothetical protein
MLVGVLLAVLTICTPLASQVCLEDLGPAHPVGATINGSAAPNQSSNDCACCASCICCHGYAVKLSVTSVAIVDSLDLLRSDAQAAELHGIALRIEKPPRG